MAPRLAPTSSKPHVVHHIDRRENTGAPREAAECFIYLEPKAALPRHVLARQRRGPGAATIARRGYGAHATLRRPRVRVHWLLDRRRLTERGRLLRVAMAAYEWALTKYAPNDIIPFGRSLGSAPACYIASQATQPVGGLILQSPLLSGANALLGSVVAFGFFFLDILKNYNHILNARCRVAITHGTADGVVPCWNVRVHSRLFFLSLCLLADASLTHRAASSTLSPPTRTSRSGSEVGATTTWTRRRSSSGRPISSSSST